MKWRPSKRVRRRRRVAAANRAWKAAHDTRPDAAVWDAAADDELTRAHGHIVHYMHVLYMEAAGRPFRACQLGRPLAVVRTWAHFRTLVADDARNALRAAAHLRRLARKAEAAA